jgi:hypothetical protein
MGREKTAQMGLSLIHQVDSGNHLVVNERGDLNSLQSGDGLSPDDLITGGAMLEAMGGKILKCHRVLEFEQHRTLEAYARDLYERRKRSTTEFEKMLYKLLLNSLYGKFGESPLKQAAYFHPPDTAGMNLVMPGVYLAEEMQEIAHEHVPISTHITAFARRTLYRFNKLCLDLGGKIYYNDTDSCVTTISPDRFDKNYEWIPGKKGILGKELGQMKHEYHVRGGQFVAPKIYMLDADDMDTVGKLLAGGMKEKDARKYAGRNNEELVQRLMGEGVDKKTAHELSRKDVIRAKGFSRMTTEKFQDLIEGREIEVRRMSRVRELLRTGQLTPRETPIRKRLQIEKLPTGEMKFKMRSKRRMLMKENDSRPWDIKELFEGDPLAATVK